ncbi:MAG: hypothetical protein U1F43_07400 [Myxococcota bacterium]
MHTSPGVGVPSWLPTQAGTTQCGGVPPAVEHHTPKAPQSPRAQAASTMTSPSQCGVQAAMVHWGPTPKSPHVSPKAPQSAREQSLTTTALPSQWSGQDGVPQMGLPSSFSTQSRPKPAQSPRPQSASTMTVPSQGAVLPTLQVGVRAP